ncbi:CcdC protein domain-containing protein [Sphingomonas sp. URHD0057]|uniref:CcdC protein domain-containing protein n=1 Tax=Sphingomonas sp. URHD0057 TaxID=1380389 RepID=UPI00048F848E|nr:CcdC protein domain-containing protein [Sphingomonas sp. URHD0057]
MHQSGGNWVTALVPFVIIAVVLALRFRSMSKERPLKVETLWVVPVVYLLLAGSMLVALPPPPIGWGLAVLGIGVGAAIGWHRGKLIRIHRDAESGELRQKASPIAIVLLAALVVLKLGARAIFGDTAVGHPGSGAMLLTDAFIGFALGLLSATRLELFLRARQIPAAQ